MPTLRQAVRSRLLRLSVVAAGLAYTLSAWSQVDVSRDLETIRTNRHMPGISAMAIKQGHIVAQGAAGYRRQGANTPFLVTDPVDIGSCTKWMTATLAGRLVDRGIIDWNTRVCDLFTNYPAFNAAFTNVTLDQLLCHRGGVQDETTFDANHWSTFMTQTGSVSHLRRWVSDTVLKDAPQVPPGQYLYANQGYAVAATMMEIASGTDWEALIQQEVFTPLRMNTAMLGEVFDNTLPPRAPVGHDLNTNTFALTPRAKLPLNFEYHCRASIGASGYVGLTLKDWAKFINLHTRDHVSDYLTSTSILARLKLPYDLHQSIGNSDMGRGVMVLYWPFAGENGLYHGGDCFGQDSEVYVWPRNQFTVLVAVNCSINNHTSAAINDALNLLAGYFYANPSGPLLEDPAAGSLAAGDKVVFDYLTLPGVSYLVESSSNLLRSNWTPANGANGQTATNLKSRYSETRSAPVKFYRVKAGPNGSAP
jgi:CubicO group peptidase (beta-lactamase class C family)